MSLFKKVIAVNDTDESLKSKVGGKFGLNQGVFITKFEFNANAGKDNTAANAVDIHIMVGEKEFRRRLYDDVGELIDRKGNKVKQGEEGYNDLYEASMSQKIAVVKHALKALNVQQPQIDALINSLPDSTTMAEGMAKLVTLVPAGFEKMPVDVFLEYQWNIAEDQDRTFLELPKNMKGGYFLCPTQPGIFVEERTEEGKLIYRNQNGLAHPFERDKNFMESNKANQQIAGQENAALAAAAGIAPGGQSAQTAKTGTW